MAFQFNPMTIGITDLRDIVDTAAAYGIKPNPKVAHGIQLYETLHPRVTTVPAVTLLDLTEDEAIEHAFAIARSKATFMPGQPAVGVAVSTLQDQAVRETWEILAADTDRIIQELRPTFDAAAGQVHAAVEAGIRPHSTAQDVLDLEDATAAALWNDLNTHVRALERIKNLRVKMSTKLGLPPQAFYNGDVITDYTACFADPDTGIKAGAIFAYANNAIGRKTFTEPRQEWLALAAATKGKMQLN
ncbi:hypothetical protein [Pseudarthrobacter sp. Y6]|uniref:hypothetical protein n=1 Tax=Pseudarthrobacter sp. Y6 TaxID=3418422 RepID=UPI003CF571E7